MALKASKTAGTSLFNAFFSFIYVTENRISIFYLPFSTLDVASEENTPHRYNIQYPRSQLSAVPLYQGSRICDCILYNAKAESICRSSIYSHVKIERLYVNIGGERSSLWCCVRRDEMENWGSERGGLVYFNSVCISRGETVRESNQVICHPIPRSWYSIPLSSSLQPLLLQDTTLLILLDNSISITLQSENVFRTQMKAPGTKLIL